jgi:Mrp family chromosome partitioning ATPase/capsular polysaccharide biosynthesis protein
MLPATTTESPAKPIPVAPRPSGLAKGVAKPLEEASGLRVFTYLKLHWLKIVFCGLVLGGSGAYAAWELLASKYESTALLQVYSVPAALGNQNNPNQARTDFVTYLKTTSALIKSDFVLTAALRDLKDSPTLKAQKDPIKYLEEELIVTWQDGSEVIRVSFKSHEPADAKRIVDAVQKAFMSEVIQKEVLEKKQFVQKVEDALVEMRRVLDLNVEGNDKTGAKNAKAVPGLGGAGVIPAGGVAGGDAANPPAAMPLPPVAPGVANAAVGPPAPGAPGAPAGPAAPGVLQAGNMSAVPLPNFAMDLGRINPSILLGKVAQLQTQIERLPLVMNAEQRRLSVLKQKMDAIKTAPLSQITLDAVEKDPEVIVQIIKMKTSKREFDFRSSTGDPESPGVQELKASYEAQEAKLAQLRKEKAELYEREKRVEAANKIGAEMEQVIGNLQKLQEEFETDKLLLSRADLQMADIPFPTGKGLGFDPREVHYNPEISKQDSTDSIYRRLVQQYFLTKLELNSPARVRLVQPASNPTQKDMKKQVIGTVFAGLMGFGLMALGVIAFETFTKKVSCLSDVKCASNVPVVGVIPCQPGEANGKDPLKRAAANEAIDKLRAYVSQTWLARGATTVAITSPIGDDGKAFAAFGLASSLAQSGYKTLLVDFDLRDPQLHAFAGVENLSGVSELLRAETDPRSALQFLPNGLHLLTAGKWSDEARQAATGEKLQSLLNKLKSPYDCVVLHAHALLTAAESVEVARRCEVVLVCARYRETTSPLLKRAAERIAAMEIPYSGVVYIGATDQEALC